MFEMQKMSAVGKRGYLGPIGDDFPSIFPVALGLIFFFGAITLTYNDYHYKQEITNLMRSNLALSKAVRTQLHFTEDYWGDIGDTGTACNLLGRTKANYAVQARMCIKDIHLKPGTDDVILGAEEDEFAPFESGRFAKWCGDTDDDTINNREIFVTMYYPITMAKKNLRASNTVAPRTLVIETWKA